MGCLDIFTLNQPTNQHIYNMVGHVAEPRVACEVTCSRSPVHHQFSWLVGFGFNGPLRQYFSLYPAVSQREGGRGKKGQTRVKMSKQPPPAPTASAVGPCPTKIQIVGRPAPSSIKTIVMFVKKFRRSCGSPSRYHLSL